MLHRCSLVPGVRISLNPLAVWGSGVMEDCSPVVEFRIHDAACGVESATVSCRMPMKRVDLNGSGEGYVPDAGRFASAFERACQAFKREFERG